MMKKTIAVVDDDQPILEVMTLILEEEGYKVIPYVCGEDLLRDKELSKIDLVLLDYRLPYRNGAEIASLLKRRRGAKDVPVIIISANHNVEAVLQKPPIDDFIPKPFEIQVLMDKVQTYLPYTS